MRFFFFLFFLSFPAFAQNALPDQMPQAPQITFAQQVDIVVTAKKDPRLFDLKISQQEAMVLLDAIVDRRMTREEAQVLAQALITLTKIRSIDDKPKEKDKPGKGLYDYRVTVSRPDGVMLITALKPHAQEKVDFEDQAFEAEPLTRAGASDR